MFNVAFIRDSTGLFLPTGSAHTPLLINCFAISLTCLSVKSGVSSDFLREESQFFNISSFNLSHLNVRFGIEMFS